MALFNKLEIDGRMAVNLIISIIIIPSTHYFFSDWPKAYSEFLNSTPGTSSSCRLYKVTGNHVMYNSGAWVLRVIMSSSRACVACRLWRSKSMTSRFASLTEQDIEKLRTHKTQKGRRRWQRSCFLITWKKKKKKTY